MAAKRARTTVVKRPPRRPNERLWFKTNLKLGHLLLKDVGGGDGGEGASGGGPSLAALGRLHRVVRELLRCCEGEGGQGEGGEGGAGGGDNKRGTQLLEVGGIGFVRVCVFFHHLKNEPTHTDAQTHTHTHRHTHTYTQTHTHTHTHTHNTQVYALQMQLHSLRRDSRRLQELYRQALRVTWGIPHPRTLGLLQVCVWVDGWDGYIYS